MPERAIQYYVEYHKKDALEPVCGNGGGGGSDDDWTDDDNNSRGEGGEEEGEEEEGGGSVEIGILEVVCIPEDEIPEGSTTTFPICENDTNDDGTG